MVGFWCCCEETNTRPRPTYYRTEDNGTDWVSVTTSPFLGQLTASNHQVFWLNRRGVFGQNYPASRGVPVSAGADAGVRNWQYSGNSLFERSPGEQTGWLTYQVPLVQSEEEILRAELRCPMFTSSRTSTLISDYLWEFSGGWYNRNENGFTRTYLESNPYLLPPYWSLPTADDGRGWNYTDSNGLIIENLYDAQESASLRIRILDVDSVTDVGTTVMDYQDLLNIATSTDFVDWQGNTSSFTLIPDPDGFPQDPGTGWFGDNNSFMHSSPTYYDADNQPWLVLADVKDLLQLVIDRPGWAPGTTSAGSGYQVGQVGFRFDNNASDFYNKADVASDPDDDRIPWAAKFSLTSTMGVPWHLYIETTERVIDVHGGNTSNWGTYTPPWVP